jgi:hypothetical protein
MSLPASDTMESSITTDQVQLQDWLPLIRAEYEELQTLRLTQSQVEELWGFDATVANAVLSALVSAGVLKKTRRGTYVRA